MIDTITRFLNNVRDGSVREALRAILNPISDRFLPHDGWYLPPLADRRWPATAPCRNDPPPAS